VVVAPVLTGVVYPAGPAVTEGTYVGVRDRSQSAADAPRRRHVPPAARQLEVATTPTATEGRPAPRRRGGSGGRRGGTAG
jgi:hypothetical protein